MNQEEYRLYRREQNLALKKPEWFHEAGLLTQVEPSSQAERQGVVVLSSTTFQTTSVRFRTIITPKGYNEKNLPTWNLHWKITYQARNDTPVEIHGSMVLPERDLRIAFVLPRGADQLCATLSRHSKGIWLIGAYSRRGRYLNIPFETFPSISIYVSEEIRKALYHLIDVRKERESKKV